MAYSWRHPAFTVTVESGFIDARRWVVHGVVDPRADLAASAWERFEAEARLELMLGIVRESRRGRDLGAHSVHVVVEGDRETEGFFRLLDREGHPSQAD